ncbi:MAG TPA: TonB-dependent receptor [Polyangiaceae bacterium]
MSAGPFRRTRRLCGALLAATAVVAASAPALAQDTSDLQQLLAEPVITTASKSAETASVAPAMSTTITATDLRRYGIHTLAEALDFLSLGAWTSSNGTTTDVGARGVILPQDRGSHVLLLVDGHAVNEPIFGTALVDRGSGIPLEMIDHIEVILGPGSVLYGSNAMLGVINVITKRAKEWQGGHAVGEWEIGKGARAAAGVGLVLGEDAEVTFMAEYYRQYGPSLNVLTEQNGFDEVALHPFQFHAGGPRDGVWGGTTTNTPRADIPSGVLHLTWRNFDVEMGGKIDKQSLPYDINDVSGEAYFDDPYAFQTNRHLWVDAKHHATLSEVVLLTSRVYADTYDYERTADTSAGAECLIYGSANCRADATGVGQWMGLEEQVSFDWLRDTSLVTLVGAEGRLRRVNTKTDTLDYDAFVAGATRNIRSSYDVIGYRDETLGAYAQQTWRPTPWLGLNAGARLDVDPRFSPQVSPRAAATVNPWKGGTFKAIYAQAFRAPSIGESYSYGPDQLAAQNLRPEVERSVEGSLEQQIVGPNKLVFGVFRSWWDDLIELHLLSLQEIAQAEANGSLSLLNNSIVTQYRNLTTIEASGFDGGVEGATTDGSLRYALNVSAATTTFDDGRGPTHPVPVAPTIFGNARVSYDLPGALPTVALAGRVLGQRPTDRAFDGNFSPPPFVGPELGLRGTISGDIPILKGLSYRATIDYTSASFAPYVVGPVQSAVFAGPQTGPAVVVGNPYVLAPLDTFRATVGLQWDFGSGQ